MTVDILTPTPNSFPKLQGGLAHRMEVSIMNNHAALVTTLQAGRVVRTSGGDQTFDVKGGSRGLEQRGDGSRNNRHPTHNATTRPSGRVARFRCGRLALEDGVGAVELLRRKNPNQLVGKGELA